MVIMNLPTRKGANRNKIFGVRSVRAGLAATALIATMGLSGVTASAQNADVQAYKAALAQIDNQRVALMQKRYFLEKQKAEIEALQSELSTVPTLTAGFDEILDKMAAQMEDAINADLPFMREERLNRIAKLKADLANPEMSAGTKYRSALNAYKIEIGYGSSVDTYEGERPLNKGEEPIIVVQLDAKGEPLKELDGTTDLRGPQLGTYLRYGRVSLAYMNQRATSARRYDVPSGKWVDVSGNELLDIRKAIRMSRGEVAPTVVMAPAYITQ